MLFKGKKHEIEVHTKSRSTGIKLSRERLEKHLQLAGLFSQIQLAEKIADAEGILSPPRHSISRAFLEKPVSQRTVTRIALALNTEEYELYQTSSQYLVKPSSSAYSDSHDMAEEKRERNKKHFQYSLSNILFASFAVALIAIIFRNEVPFMGDRGVLKSSDDISTIVTLPLVHLAMDYQSFL